MPDLNHVCTSVFSMFLLSSRWGDWPRELCSATEELLCDMIPKGSHVVLARMTWTWRMEMNTYHLRLCVLGTCSWIISSCEVVTNLTQLLLPASYLLSLFLKIGHVLSTYFLDEIAAATLYLLPFLLPPRITKGKGKKWKPSSHESTRASLDLQRYRLWNMSLYSSAFCFQVGNVFTCVFLFKGGETIAYCLLCCRLERT